MSQAFVCIAAGSRTLPPVLPLNNCRILITRPRGQSSALAAQLEALGAQTILIPTIEIAPPASFCALDAVLTTLCSYDWLLFTSANAVDALAVRARQLNLQPHPKRIAVIGPATAAAVHQAGIHPDDPNLLIPERYVAESLAAALLPHAPGAQMLLVRAAIARDTLPDTLTAAGAHLTLAEAYRTVIPQASVAELRTLFTTAPPDAITFTSASTARNLAALLTEAALTIPSTTVLASIGPVTSQAMRELGMTPTLESEAATIPALLAALQHHFAI